MRATKAKLLRKSAADRRHYRAMKKAYTKLSRQDRTTISYHAKEEPKL